MENAEIPQLPAGNSSIFYGISENFSFHSSPESFIKARIKESQRDENDRTIFRAKILNRNVAVVSSYTHALQILEGSTVDKGSDQPRVVASTAYDKLMGPFFPSPNLLLTDGPSHNDMRKRWEHVDSLPDKIGLEVREMAMSHFAALPDDYIDLYESMKVLSWKVLLGVFLSLKQSDDHFTQIEALHEDLLRGQFSLFPVSVNTGFWHSPRKKGINAKEKLQDILYSRISSTPESCPFKASEAQSQQEIADHVLLFTSSLAAKGLASVLTAFLLNLFLFKHGSGESIADSIREKEPEEQRIHLESALKETQRLSPPIVGNMRRVTEDILLKESSSEVLIPRGWDCWVYFVGASRDPATFGTNTEEYDPERYLNQSTPFPLAFGAGPKTCLGRDVVSTIALEVATACLQNILKFEGEITALGVKRWLGWDVTGSAEDWANDVKQLPVQRPRNPINVRIPRPQAQR